MWQVLRNGVVWTNYLSSEEYAYSHIEDCVLNGEGSTDEYTVEIMPEMAAE